MLKKIFVLFLFTLSFLNAQEWLKPAYGVWGIGANLRERNYISAKTDIMPGLFIFGGYGPLFIEANRLGYTLYSNGSYFASVVAQIRSHQYRTVEEMPPVRKRSIEAGFHLGRRLGLGITGRLAVLHDIGTSHRGWEAEFQLYRAHHFGNLRLLTAIGIQLQNKALVNYYYGTPTYKPPKALGIELEVIATYRLQSWGIFNGFRLYRYSTAISQSPLARSAYINQFFSGFGYYF